MVLRQQGAAMLHASLCHRITRVMLDWLGGPEKNNKWVMFLLCNAGLPLTINVLCEWIISLSSGYVRALDV